MGAVTVLCGDKGYMFHKGSNVAKKIDAWIQKELRDSHYRECTVAYKENDEHNIYMKPRENKIDAMPLSGDSESGVCRPGVHDPMRDDVDGDEAMVRRVPNLLPEPSARQIVEHELTGHAMYRSWCRHCVASKGRAHAHSSREEGELLEIWHLIMASLVVTEKMCCQSCVSIVGTVQPDAWERQLLTGRERQITRVHF